MAGTRQPIQTVVAEALCASPIRQTRPIAHAVVAVLRLIDLRIGGSNLMQNLGDLACRIIP